MPLQNAAFPFFLYGDGGVLHGVDVKAAVDNGYCAGDK